MTGVSAWASQGVPVDGADDLGSQDRPVGGDQLLLHHIVWRMRHVTANAQLVSVAPDAVGTWIRTPYAVVADRAEALAVGLSGLGVGRGHRVSILAWNGGEYLEAMLGVPLLGAALNTINHRLGESAIGLTLDGASLVILDARLETDTAQTADLARSVRHKAQESGIPVVLIAGTPRQAGEHRYEDVLVPDTRLPHPTFGERDTAYVMHTGGTTGSPKSYAVSHRAALLHLLAQLTPGASGIGPDDRVLPVTPLAHVGAWGLPLVALTIGADLVLPGRDLAPATLAATLVAEGISLAAGVPTVWHDLCGYLAAHPTAPRPHDLRSVITGGAGVTPSVVAAVTGMLGAALAKAWGMTETLACSTYERADPAALVGRPIPLIEVTSRDGGLGPEVHVRGPIVIAPTADPDGWLSTGDLGQLDSTGRLHLEGRVKDLIKSGGEWIQPARLETALSSAPGVRSAAVVGQPDARWGERPIAWVEALDGASIDLDAVRRHAATLVPPWWIPDSIVIVDRLPRTGVGKVDKHRLKDTISQGGTR